MLGFIRRILNEFKFLSFIKMLYVRYFLVYEGIQYPFISCGNKQIKKVQWKFLKHATFILNIDYLPLDYYQYDPVLNKFGFYFLN